MICCRFTLVGDLLSWQSWPFGVDAARWIRLTSSLSTTIWLNTRKFFWHRRLAS